eukprot:CAMPEP_0206531628 /NCGR_PEP_ID=MMETSP0325_2-20121206/3871_1 /ASSEMBLY_ACC=CAM_ASM_000347 /TAXON_ID=2866 /ORGANISM="Crypthecodinium cohnii, Strain Seligo" /LENGTH=413 /DNA_ID=CAMNT_0054027893 /DNA_START=182 /DNA_END=1421 /DNA_ORIENTATION=+
MAFFALSWASQAGGAEAIQLGDVVPKELRSSPSISTDVICVHAEDVERVLNDSAEALEKNGLPPWEPSKEDEQKHYADVSIAYFIQLSQPEKLSLVKRVFDLLYSPTDAFLYSVDADKLAVADVEQALGLVGARKLSRPNVRVQAAAHADYYFWPRVQIVLDGMTQLLDEQWDFVIHLSESDYPAHSASYIRHALSQQFYPDYAALLALENGTTTYSPWFWNYVDGVAVSCGSESKAYLNTSLHWPQQEMEDVGIRFGSSSEWVILTRELVEYSAKPALIDFKRIMSLRIESDESFWATLILSIPGMTQSISQQGWFISWDRSEGQPQHSPATLNNQLGQEVFDNPNMYLFVRKVSEGNSSAFLDRIDRRIRSETLQDKSEQDVDFAKFEAPLNVERTRCPKDAPVWFLNPIF